MSGGFVWGCILKSKYSTLLNIVEISHEYCHFNHEEEYMGYNSVNNLVFITYREYYTSTTVRSFVFEEEEEEAITNLPAASAPQATGMSEPWTGALILT